jgi:hypothetical protein
MSHESGHAAAPRPVLTSTAAQLFVADINASCDFYTQKLGFAVDLFMATHPITDRSPATVRCLR